MSAMPGVRRCLRHGMKDANLLRLSEGLFYGLVWIPRTPTTIGTGATCRVAFFVAVPGLEFRDKVNRLVLLIESTVFGFAFFSALPAAIYKDTNEARDAARSKKRAGDLISFRYGDRPCHNTGDPNDETEN